MKSSWFSWPIKSPQYRNYSNYMKATSRFHKSSLMSSSLFWFYVPVVFVCLATYLGAIFSARPGASTPHLHILNPPYMKLHHTFTGPFSVYSVKFSPSKEYWIRYFFTQSVLWRGEPWVATAQTLYLAGNSTWRKYSLSASPRVLGHQTPSSLLRRPASGRKTWKGSCHDDATMLSSRIFPFSIPIG